MSGGWFDEIMADAGVDILTENLAERDERGGMAVVEYWPPGKSLKPVAWEGCILGKMLVLEVGDEQGNLAKKETIQLTGPITGEINSINQRSRFRLPGFGDRKWVPQQTGSEQTGNWLTYQLEREPLKSMGSKTNGQTV